MKKILTMILCLGFIAPLAADARPEDKAPKKQRKAFEKAQKAQEKALKAEDKAERKFGRDFRRGREQQAQLHVAPPEVSVQAQIGDWRTRRGPRSHAWTIDEARRYQHRGTRDRDWWRSRYNRFALFGGGYYYWDRGYWYPAYGYDPRYNTYIYDEPIYGYNQIEPGQMLRQVQLQLRRLGYYRGAIDGLIGPLTRSALERFQRDHGLRVTRRVDGPTMAALRVI